LSDGAPDGPSRGPLIALLVIVVLCLGGYFLFSRIRASNSLQDCVMSGRTNCAPVSGG
jgi:hypothetical protein